MGTEEKRATHSVVDALRGEEIDGERDADGEDPEDVDDEVEGTTRVRLPQSPEQVHQDQNLQCAQTRTKYKGETVPVCVSCTSGEEQRDEDSTQGVPGFFVFGQGGGQYPLEVHGLKIRFEKFFTHHNETQLCLHCKIWGTNSFPGVGGRSILIVLTPATMHNVPC